MENKMKLTVNASVCDMTEVSEETLNAYESIQFNSTVVLVTPQVRQMIAKYDISFNASDIVELPEGTEVAVRNGSTVLTVGMMTEKPTLLIANGCLTIEKGADLSSFVGIVINGQVICPQSMAGELASAKINGSMECYPDDAIRLDDIFIMDRYFVLRAKNARYYAKRFVVMADQAIDAEALKTKGTAFVTATAFIAERLVETAVGLFDEKTKIIVLPDGCAFLKGSVVLDGNLVRRHGEKLYISGSLHISEESREVLPKIKYLHVDGNVKLPQSMADAFQAVGADYQKLDIVKGLLLEDKVNLRVDRRLLEDHPEGLTINDVVNLTLAEDIPPELIEKTLIINDCVNIACTPEQLSAVEAVSSDVVSIGPGLCDSEEEGEKVKRINAMKFKM